MIETYQKGTPMLDHLGGQVVHVSEGFARCTLPLSSKVSQPLGVYHAGAILTLADEMASTAINGSTDFTDPGKQFPYAATLTANFLTNDPKGPIICESSVIKRGRSLVVVNTTVYSSNMDTMALIRSTHVMVDPKIEGPHKNGQE